MKKRKGIKNWISVLIVFIFFLNLNQSFSQSITADTNKRFSMKASFSGIRDSITIEQLLQSGKMQPDRNAFEIISVNVSGDGCFGSGYFTFKVNGASFSSTDIELIKKITRSTIFFDSILAKNKVGQLVYLTPFTYRIIPKK